MIPKSLHPIMPEKPVDTIEVFVNDFIGYTNNAELTHTFYTSHVACCMAVMPFSLPLKSRNIEVIQSRERN